MLQGELWFDRGINALISLKKLNLKLMKTNTAFVRLSLTKATKMKIKANVISTRVKSTALMTMTTTIRNTMMTLMIKNIEWWRGVSQPFICQPQLQRLDVSHPTYADLTSKRLPKWVRIRTPTYWNTTLGTPLYKQELYKGMHRHLYHFELWNQKVILFLCSNACTKLQFLLC